MMHPTFSIKFPYIVILIIIFLSFLYVYRLDTLPYATHGDEASTALQALEILHNDIKIIGVGWAYLPIFSYLPNAFFIWLFGNPIVGSRFASAIFSIFTILLFYMFVSLLYSRRIALIASLLLGTSHLWIALSRLGLPYTQATFFVVGSFYFTLAGIKHGKYRDFIMGGIFLGLCFYSYYAARITPFILFPNILLHTFVLKKIKRSICGFIFLIVTTIIVMVPQGKFFFDNPNTFSNRTETVYIFSESGKAWTQYEYGGKDPLQIVMAQFQKSINIFAGDNSGQYGYRGQLIDYATLSMFIGGIIYALLYLNVSHLFIISWFLLTIIVGQVLTTIPSPIFLPRFVVGLPAVFLFCALGFELLLKLLKYKNIASFITIVLIVFIVVYNLQVYFVQYKEHHLRGAAGDPNALVAKNIASYINSLPPSYTALFLTAPSLYADFEVLRFLAPHAKRVDIKDLSLLEKRSNIDNDLVFILYPGQQDKLTQLKRLYPEGKASSFTNSRGMTQFISYTLR